MTRKEALFLKAIEECTEVAHRCSKAIRFTLEEVQPDINSNPLQQNNGRRVIEEYMDLVVIINLLIDEGHLPEFHLSSKEIEERQKRIEKYNNYSRSLGTITN